MFIMNCILIEKKNGNSHFLNLSGRAAQVEPLYGKHCYSLARQSSVVYVPGTFHCNHLKKLSAFKDHLIDI